MAVESLFPFIADAITAFIGGAWLTWMAIGVRESRLNRRLREDLVEWQERAMRAENPEWRRWA